MTVLSDRIREDREWLGYSPEQIASKLGITLAEYAAFESGDAVPDAAQLTTLARLFGTTTERLHGAPLVAPLAAARMADAKGLSHEDRYHLYRFAEFLRHTKPPATPEATR